MNGLQRPRVPIIRDYAGTFVAPANLTVYLASRDLRFNARSVNFSLASASIFSANTVSCSADICGHQRMPASGKGSSNRPIVLGAVDRAANWVSTLDCLASSGQSACSASEPRCNGRDTLQGLRSIGVQKPTLHDGVQGRNVHTCRDSSARSAFGRALVFFTVERRTPPKRGVFRVAAETK